MEISKIKIKIGVVEVDYEGSENFLINELPKLLASVSELYGSMNLQISPGISEPASRKSAASNLESNTSPSQSFEATTAAIAAKIGCKSGPDLVMASAARLTLALQLQTFARQKIIEEMKTAAAYYKSSYLSNLTSYLDRLVKDGKLNEPSQGIYALTAMSLQDLERKLV